MTRSAPPLITQRKLNLPESLPGQWTLCDRAQVQFKESSVVISGGFLRSTVAHGDGELRFSFRAPKDGSEVQAWVGFRARDRHSRYTAALRGGNNNHLYLARLAPDGGSRFLGIAPLDFSPAVGKWFELRVVLEGSRIQVFLGTEKMPRLDVEDDETGWTQGGVVLGGGYLPTEFSQFEILPGVKPAVARFSEEKLGVKPGYRHATYRPLHIDSLSAARQEISLDGCWLFHPVLPGRSLTEAKEKSCNEQDWHTIDVPNLWTPFLSWLHGETTFLEHEGVSSSKGINDKVWLSEMKRVESYGFDWKSTQEAWYRHHLVLPENISGRCFELRFGAVAKSCEIWINGQLAGSHVGMFGEVAVEASPYLTAGENTIAVKVIRNPAHLTKKDDRIVGIAESVEVTVDMTSSLPRDIICHDPAGIWQPVSLVITSDVRVRDVYVNPGLDSASIDIEIGVAPAHRPDPIRIGYVVRDKENGEILTSNDSAAKGSAMDLSKVHIDLPKVSPRLWHPDAPHLYDLEISIFHNEEQLDRHSTTFGFRTFETQGNRFMLNGKPYWLRGANHFPHGLRPNDRELARRFIQLAREGNIRATRFHVAPLTKAWAEEADRQGLLISFEGIWPWLMLNDEPPSTALLDAWHDDFASLVRQYRNHPSIVLWTINNEMKFYVFNENNEELLKRKWAIVTRMIKTVRAIDPSRPIVADSGYVRGQYQEDYESILSPNGFDDGDVDDVHQYYSWYHPSYTTACNGEFTEGIASPSRPFISQELSSGYARNDDGLPVRFYLFKHGTPLALVGNYAYEHNDPAHYLNRLAFTTKETIEAIRRCNRNEAAGALSFSYLTWFKNVHEPSLEPWAPYHALKLALQPVLVSVELSGRHFFSGERLALDVVIINDAIETIPISPGQLAWEIVDQNGRSLVAGNTASPQVDYYTNVRIPVEFRMPECVEERCEATLRVSLIADGHTISENHYEILVASRKWALEPLARTGWECGTAFETSHALNAEAAPLPETNPFLIVSGSDANIAESLPLLRRYVEKGGHLLFLNAGELLPIMLPGIVKSYRKVRGEIVHAFLPESPVFEGLESRDLAWFHSQRPAPALACEGVFRVDREYPKMTVLAEFCDYHNYLNNPEDIVEYSGSPLWECRLGRGIILASEMNFEAASHDPVAARLQANLFAYLAGLPANVGAQVENEEITAG